MHYPPPPLPDDDSVIMNNERHVKIFIPTKNTCNRKKDGRVFTILSFSKTPYHYYHQQHL